MWRNRGTRIVNRPKNRVCVETMVNGQTRHTCGVRRVCKLQNRVPATSIGMELLAPIALPTGLCCRPRRRKFHVLAQFSRRIWAQANRNRAGLSSCRGSSASLRVIDVSPPSKQINLSKRGIKRDQSSGDYSILSNVSNGGSQTHSRQALRLHGAVSAPTTPKFQAASRGLCHASGHGARP